MPPLEGSPAQAGGRLFLRLVYPYPVNLHAGHTAYRFVEATGKQDIHGFLRNTGCLGKYFGIVYFPDQLVGGPFKGKNKKVVSVF